MKLTTRIGGKSALGDSKSRALNTILPDELFQRAHFANGYAVRCGQFNKIVLNTPKKDKVPEREKEVQGCVYICGYLADYSLKYYQGEVLFDAEKKEFSVQFESAHSWVLSDSIVSRRLSEDLKKAGDCAIDPNWNNAKYSVPYIIRRPNYETGGFDEAVQVFSDWRNEILLSGNDYFIAAPFSLGRDYIKRFGYNSLTKSARDGSANKEYYSQTAKDLFEPVGISILEIAQKGLTEEIKKCPKCGTIYTTVGNDEIPNVNVEKLKIVSCFFDTQRIFEQLLLYYFNIKHFKILHDAQNKNITEQLKNSYWNFEREIYDFLKNGQADFRKYALSMDNFQQCSETALNPDYPLVHHLQEATYLPYYSYDMDVTQYEYNPFLKYFPTQLQEEAFSVAWINSITGQTIKNLKIGDENLILNDYAKQNTVYYGDNNLRNNFANRNYLKNDVFNKSIQYFDNNNYIQSEYYTLNYDYNLSTCYYINDATPDEHYFDQETFVTFSDFHLVYSKTIEGPNPGKRDVTERYVCLQNPDFTNIVSKYLAHNKVYTGERLEAEKCNFSFQLPKTNKWAGKYYFPQRFTCGVIEVPKLPSEDIHNYDNVVIRQFFNETEKVAVFDREEITVTKTYIDFDFNVSEETKTNKTTLYADKIKPPYSYIGLMNYHLAKLSSSYNNISSIAANEMQIGGDGVKIPIAHNDFIKIQEKKIRLNGNYIIDYTDTSNVIRGGRVYILKEYYFEKTAFETYDKHAIDIKSLLVSNSDEENKYNGSLSPKPRKITELTQGTLTFEFYDNNFSYQGAEIFASKTNGRVFLDPELPEDYVTRVYIQTGTVNNLVLSSSAEFDNYIQIKGPSNYKGYFYRKQFKNNYQTRKDALGDWEYLHNASLPLITSKNNPTPRVLNPTVRRINSAGSYWQGYQNMRFSVVSAIFKPWIENTVTFIGLVPDEKKNAGEVYKESEFNRFHKLGAAYQNYWVEGIYPHINGNICMINSWLSDLTEGLQGPEVNIQRLCDDENIKWSAGFNMPCDTALISEVNPADFSIVRYDNVFSKDNGAGYNTNKGVFPIIKSFWQNKENTNTISSALFLIETQCLIEGPSYFFAYTADAMPRGLEENYTAYLSRGLMMAVEKNGVYYSYVLNDCGFFDYFPIQNKKRFPINRMRAYDDAPAALTEEIGYYSDFEEAFNRLELSGKYTFATQLAAKMSFSVGVGNQNILFLMAYDIDNFPEPNEENKPSKIEVTIEPENAYSFVCAYLTVELGNEINVPHAFVNFVLKDFVHQTEIRRGIVRVVRQRVLNEKASVIQLAVSDSIQNEPDLFYTGEKQIFLMVFVNEENKLTIRNLQFNILPEIIEEKEVFFTRFGILDTLDFVNENGNAERALLLPAYHNENNQMYMFVARFKDLIVENQNEKKIWQNAGLIGDGYLSHLTVGENEKEAA